MSFLRGYIFTLCSFIVISSLVFVAVPSGGIKNTLKTVIGIVIALVAIAPFTGGISIEMFSFEKPQELVDYKRAEKMNIFIMGRTEEELSEIIKNQLEDAGKSNVEVEVEMSAEGEIKRVKVKDVTEEDKRVIYEKVGIETEQIEEL